MYVVVVGLLLLLEVPHVVDGVERWLMDQAAPLIVRRR